MSPIVEYLEELAGQLRRGHRRRILAEVRAHLLESAAAEGLTGGDRDRAERGAIERFGPPARSRASSTPCAAGRWHSCTAPLP